MAARYRKPSSVGMYERYCRRIRRAAREGTAVEARSGTILLLAALIPLCHPAFAQGPSPPNQVQRIRRQYLYVVHPVLSCQMSRAGQDALLVLEIALGHGDGRGGGRVKG